MLVLSTTGGFGGAARLGWQVNVCVAGLAFALLEEATEFADHVLRFGDSHVA